MASIYSEKSCFKLKFIFKEEKYSVTRSGQG